MNAKKMQAISRHVSLRKSAQFPKVVDLRPNHMVRIVCADCGREFRDLLGSIAHQSRCPLKKGRFTTDAEVIHQMLERGILVCMHCQKEITQDNHGGVAWHDGQGAYDLAQAWHARCATVAESTVEEPDWADTDAHHEYTAYGSAGVAPWKRGL